MLYLYIVLNLYVLLFIVDDVICYDKQIKGYEASLLFLCPIAFCVVIFGLTYNDIKRKKYYAKLTAAK